jgi:hypothetical protein
LLACYERFKIEPQLAAIITNTCLTLGVSIKNNEPIE